MFVLLTYSAILLYLVIQKGDQKKKKEQCEGIGISRKEKSVTRQVKMKNN